MVLTRTTAGIMTYISIGLPPPLTPTAMWLGVNYYFWKFSKSRTETTSRVAAEKVFAENVLRRRFKKAKKNSYICAVVKHFFPTGSRSSPIFLWILIKNQKQM